MGHPGGAASTVHCVHDVGGTAKVGDLLSTFFDGGAGGLFAPGAVDEDAQRDLLAALDNRVPQDEIAVCRGPAGNGSVSAACLASAIYFVGRRNVTELEN